MNQLATLAFVVLALLGALPAAQADGAFPPRRSTGRQDLGDRPPHQEDRGPLDNDRGPLSRSARSVYFNVVCRYAGAAPGPAVCYAASRFSKSVATDGDELEDNSEYPENPKFQVECDGHTIFNDGARRFTDRSGTRIQASTGPYPAILLPKKSLRDGRRKASSVLELRDFALEGHCEVYPGNP